MINPHDSRTWPECPDCGLRHRDPTRCFYPPLRARFGDLTPEQERFLRWMAGWDQWTVERFDELLDVPLKLARKATS